VPNNFSSSQIISSDTKSFIKLKAITFLKQSFLIPFIFATLSYILMRVFFIGSVFDLAETVELYIKTFLVTWAYINAWRLICHGIIWIETKTTRVKFNKIITIEVLKKTAVVILVAGLAFTVKARSINRPAQKQTHEIVKADETNNDIDPKFYLWMK
jgi:hypothetical protein